MTRELPGAREAGEMNAKLIVLASALAVLFLNGCAAVSHPEPAPTAETGASHGAPTKPSTSNQ